MVNGKSGSESFQEAKKGECKMEEKCIRQVTSGMRGYFPVHIGIFQSEHGGTYPDTIQTGMTARNFKDAENMAKEWALAEGLEYK